MSGIETKLIKSINSQAVSQANEKETVDEVVVVRMPHQKVVKAVYFNSQNAPAVTVSGARVSGAVCGGGIGGQQTQTSNGGNSLRV